jgi:Flp pilus assembly protein TadB
MIVWAVLCAAVAGFLMPGRRSARTRLRVFLPVQSRGGDAGRPVLLRRLSALAAGLACGVFLGGVVGCCAGVVVAVVCERFMARLEPAAVRLRRARIAGDLPIAVDLLAACLRGGTSWSTAVESVAEALGGPLGEELQAVAAQVRLGADPAEAWLTLAGEPALESLARTVARASESGASLAPVLGRLAKDQRRAAQGAAMARARSAGVRAVAPLGLCFLPAFVFLGIVPAIVGIAATLHLP